MLSLPSVLRPSPANRGLADLRLAVVSPFVDRSHGTERALAELLERLAQRHHCEIHLYSQRVQDLAFCKPNATRTENTGVILWHRVPHLPGPHLLGFVAWVALNTLLRWGHRFSRSTPFDLVLSPGINTFGADVVMVHVLFCRLQEISRENDAHTDLRVGFLQRIHRRTYYALLAALERRTYCDRNVLLACVSRRTAGLLARCFQRNDVRVIPNAIDPAQFSPSMRLARRTQARASRNFCDTDFVLLLVGNDWAVKGVPTILAAIAALPTFPTFPLHLLAAGTDNAAPFREMAARLNISARFHCEPARTDVIDFYAAADLYVSPSREDSFGLPVLEAMACGLPAITSIFAGVAELLANEVDAFVLRDPNDVGALAQLLQRLYADEPLRNRIAEAAILAARRYTWDHNAAEIWELLKFAAEKKVAGTNSVG
jgi:glycosyltransferase involved in cell wall biosynthesis